jgi:hypothetical protein
MKIHIVLVSLSILFSTFMPILAKDVQVKGYTRKDGTVVKGYTREAKGKQGKSAEKIEVKEYTRKDGTVVKGYTRTKVEKKSAK